MGLSIGRGYSRGGEGIPLVACAEPEGFLEGLLVVQVCLDGLEIE